MTKRKLKRAVGGSNHDRFVRLPHYLLKSAAWRTMPPSAKALLLEVWLRHNGVNNGEISFACSEAPKLLGFSPATAKRMFDILIDRGFLIVVRDACFDVKNKKARTWRITAEPCGGTPATKDFMRWRTVSTNAVSKNHFTVSPMKPDSFTHETKDAKLTQTVSPTKPTEPVLADSRFHQRNTYNLPCRDSVPAPMAPDWVPNRVTTLAAIAGGLGWSRVFPSSQQFRLHHLNSGELSSNWDDAWLASLRATFTTSAGDD
jgi:hypothetical protein